MRQCRSDKHQWLSWVFGSLVMGAPLPRDLGDSVPTTSGYLLILGGREAAVLTYKWRKWASFLGEWPHKIQPYPVHIYHFWSLASPLVVGTGHFSHPRPASLFGSRSRKAQEQCGGQAPRVQGGNPHLLGVTVPGEGLSLSRSEG